MWRKLVLVGRLVGAVLPFLLACYGGVTLALAQAGTLEGRMAMIEIDNARQDERFHAIVARIDAIDKTLWWLVVATVSGTGVSGAVAADRIVYKRRNGRQ
jgi:hypothetical protein